MDAWFEEDDEVFVHPRDPYHRVDLVNSSRHVMLCFYDGKVDAVYVDGELQPKPVTPWS
jgi:hypothetical protein